MALVASFIVNYECDNCRRVVYVFFVNYPKVSDYCSRVDLDYDESINAVFGKMKGIDVGWNLWLWELDGWMYQIIPYLCHNIVGKVLTDTGEIFNIALRCIHKDKPFKEYDGTMVLDSRFSNHGWIPFGGMEKMEDVSSELEGCIITEPIGCDDCKNKMLQLITEKAKTQRVCVLGGNVVYVKDGEELGYTAIEMLKAYYDPCHKVKALYNGRIVEFGYGKSPLLK